MARLITNKKIMVIPFLFCDPVTSINFFFIKREVYFAKKPKKVYIFANIWAIQYFSTGTNNFKAIV